MFPICVFAFTCILMHYVCFIYGVCMEYLYFILLLSFPKKRNKRQFLKVSAKFACIGKIVKCLIFDLLPLGNINPKNLFKWES